MTPQHATQTQVATPSMRRRAGEWAKLIAITGSAQVMVQAIGFLSGILVIRLLPTHVSMGSDPTTYLTKNHY